MTLSGKIRESTQISQWNCSSGKEVLEMIKEYLKINLDKPMGSFEGRISSEEVPDHIKGNDTIKLNRPIGSLKGSRQLA